jgi:streptogramin lyase
VDEAVLGKAMLIEYDLPRPTSPTPAAGQNPYFDDLGNVWSTDRGFPNAIVKLDPAATFEQFLLPTQGVPHGITIDAKGAVWIGETVGFVSQARSRQWQDRTLPDRPARLHQGPRP